MRELRTRALSGVAMLAFALAALWMGGITFAVLALAAGYVMSREWNALTYRFGRAVQLAGLPYVAFPIAALIVLRAAPNGFALTLWTLAIVWATDIGAYFAGRTFGGPKLARAISPSKTWSGLAGGMLAAWAAGFTLAGWADLPSLCLWLGAPLAVLAQGGDLFESWLKRKAGVKDSGSILPGHGGALDRLDGLVPVAIVVGLLHLGGWL